MASFNHFFNIAHLNIRGLASKLDEVKGVISKHKFQIFCLTETFIHKDEKDNFYEIPGYDIIRRDRAEKFGGGILCYIQNSFNYEQLTALDQSMPESLSILLKPNHQKKFVISFIYRPPSKPVAWNETFIDHIENCFEISDDVAFLGDFNVNLKDDKLKRKWFDGVISQFPLSQLVSECTRVSAKTSSLLDHIYVSKSQMYCRTQVLYYAMSDHYLTCTSKKLGNVLKPPKERIKIECLDYTKFTDENVYNVFRDVSWDRILIEPDANDMLEQFNVQYGSLIGRLIVKKTRFVKSRVLPPWLDEEVRAEMKVRDELKLQEDWSGYRIKRNLVTNMIRRKKKLHMDRLIKSSDKSFNTKPLWDALNVSSKKRPNYSSELHAEELNDHFTTIAEKITGSIRNDTCSDQTGFTQSKIVSVPHVTPAECIKYLSGISNSKSTGCDTFSVRMLKKTFPYIVNIVTDMMNRFLIEGIFPKQWKLARVSPIFKGGDIDKAVNYRPISVLPILSKLFEKHLNTHLQNYLESNQILYRCQSGFRKGFSCSDAMHKIYSDCVNWKSQGNYVSIISLDFKKAFDCVDHNNLVEKLRRYGISGSFLNLLTSFLDNRMQCVYFNQQTSSFRPIKMGVPQGSIIAPTLFSIFINDLLNLHLFSTVNAYADDTTYVARSHNIYFLERSCNNDLEMVNNWCRLNKMVINTSKSHYLLCNASEDTRFSISIDGTVLERRSKSRLLGYTICDTLSWNDHVSNLCDRIRSNVALLQQCRFCISRKAAVMFYHHFLFCHFIYGIHIYYGMTPLYITNPLYLLQKRAFRLITNFQSVPRHLVSTQDLARSLNLLPLPQLASYFTAIYGYKILKLMTPEYVYNQFLNQSHRFPIRDVSILKAPNDNNFLNRIAITFNNLPENIRSQTKFSSFKNLSFKHFMSHA